MTIKTNALSTVETPLGNTSSLWTSGGNGLGLKVTDGTGAWGNGPADGSVYVSFWRTADYAFANDQAAQVTLGTLNASDDVGCAVRCAGSNGYLLLTGGGFGFQGMTIYKVTGGVASSLLTIDLRPSTIVAGDTLKLDVTGTTLTAYWNGVSRGSVTDATYASGQPGVAASPGNNNSSRLTAFTGTDGVSYTAPGVTVADNPAARQWYAEALQWWKAATTAQPRGGIVPVGPPPFGAVGVVGTDQRAWYLEALQWWKATTQARTIGGTPGAIPPFGAVTVSGTDVRAWYLEAWPWWPNVAASQPRGGVVPVGVPPFGAVATVVADQRAWYAEAMQWWKVATVAQAVGGVVPLPPVSAAAAPDARAWYLAALQWWRTTTTAAPAGGVPDIDAGALGFDVQLDMAAVLGLDNPDLLLANVVVSDSAAARLWYAQAMQWWRATTMAQRPAGGRLPVALVPQRSSQARYLVTRVWT